MKTNWPNQCLLFVSSKFLQGIESLRIKTKSFKSCWGLWVSTICCRAGVARGQKFLKELRNFQKSFDNFRNELEVQLHCKQSKPETLFTKMMLLEKAKNWQLFSVSLLQFFVWSVWVAASRYTELKLLCEEVCCLTCDRKSTLFTKVDLHVSCFRGSVISSCFLTWILVVSMMRIGELHFWRNHCFIFLIVFFLQFHHIIYFDISSRVFWCRCCQFSVDLSQDFGSI